MRFLILALMLSACAAPAPEVGPPRRTLAFATTLKEVPEASDVPDAALRTALVESGWPWLVRHEHTGIELVLIPPGRYLRGAPDSDSEARNEERPAHDALVTDFFYLARTETTQAQWQRVFERNPSEFPGADRPVENVTVKEVYAFCREAGLTLPTEVQWEWACRAGSKRARYGSASEIAWHYENSSGETHPVATKQPNGFGLFDMLGNVWELTRGDWTESYESFAATGTDR